MLNGYKTYIGIAIWVLGALGLGSLITEPELAKTVNSILEVIGTCVAVYGRYKATKN
jgi:hypothetical protein